MEVSDLKGKKTGVIKDILIDLSKFKVIGFLVSSFKFFKRESVILTENVICFKDNMIIKETGTGKYLKLSEVKNMEVVDLRGNILGLLEDIIFEEDSFIIHGIIVSNNVINNLIEGKKILMIRDLILGELNITFLGAADKVQLLSLPHKFLQKGISNEKAL